MRKMWLSAFEPDKAYYSSQAKLAIKNGDEVGDFAKTLYGTDRSVEVPLSSDWDAMVRRTEELLSQDEKFPIFEATFVHGNVIVRVDVLLPHGDGWRAVEIKSSKSKKLEHEIDCAVQWWVMKHAGLNITAMALGHVSGDFVYAGDGNYDGLIEEVDLTEKVIKLQPEIEMLIEESTAALQGPMPEVLLGKKCTHPHDCEFFRVCYPMDEEYPVPALHGSKANHADWINRGIKDLRQVPMAELTEDRPVRVHRVTCAGGPELIPGAKEKLEALGYPRYYLDFEAISKAIPPWKGLDPYMHVPVQYSVHIDDGKGDGSVESMEHREFLQLTSEAPMRNLAKQLIEDLGNSGPIFMYSNYEKRMINALIKLHPDLKDKLEPMIGRLEDLKDIVHDHYYHPCMLGSWSIKDVLPAIAPHLSYEKLQGIKNGAMAVDGYIEAIDPATSAERKAELEQELLTYCRFDTEAMVEIARFLSKG
jgi:hypothetical protein